MSGGAIPALFGAAAPAVGAGVGTAATGAGATAATAGAAKGLGSLLAPALVGQGVGMGASGMMGTPESKSTSYSQLPQMDTPSDPWELFAQLTKQSKGGMS